MIVIIRIQEYTSKINKYNHESSSKEVAGKSNRKSFEIWTAVPTWDTKQNKT